MFTLEAKNERFTKVYKYSLFVRVILRHLLCFVADSVWMNYSVGLLVSYNL
jgi:hypothetical protein